MDYKRAAAALRQISEGFASLASVFEEAPVQEVAGSTEKPANRRSGPKPGREPEAPVEDDEPFPQTDEEQPAEKSEPKASAKKVKLEDLQAAGKALIDTGKRAEFKAVLDEFKVKNLSSADEGDYAAILEKLQAAA